MSCDQRSTKGLAEQHLINSFFLPGQRLPTFPKTSRTKRVSNNFKLSDESTHNNKLFLIWSLPGVFSYYCITFLHNMVKINRSYLLVAFVGFQGSVYAYVRQSTFVSINI